MALTAAYGAFANGGIVHEPVLIRKVEDSEGTVLYEDEQKSQRAVSESTAFLMASMLADVVNSGTAYRARQAGFTLPAAGKTGTTNDYLDAWFVGFTPTVVTGVWLGFDQPRTIINNGYAGELAVPLWASFMKAATKGNKSDWFERPSNVTATNVCRISGKLPNAGCDRVEVVSRDGFVEPRSMVYTEYFVKGSQPNTVCPLHTTPSFFDRLAGVFGKDSDAPPPVPAAEAGLPAPPAAGTTGVGPAPPATARPEASKEEKVEEPKKRGFWSKLFGRGKDDPKKDDKKKPDEKKKPGGGRP
jgi:penicillin-binding protein 1A